MGCTGTLSKISRFTLIAQLLEGAKDVRNVTKCGYLYKYRPFGGGYFTPPWSLRFFRWILTPVPRVFIRNSVLYIDEGLRHGLVHLFAQAYGSSTTSFCGSLAASLGRACSTTRAKRIPTYTHAHVLNSTKASPLRSANESHQLYTHEPEAAQILPEPPTEKRRAQAVETSRV
eukprot:1178999-Prorocentrum_minimum.AAC.7